MICLVVLALSLAVVGVAIAAGTVAAQASGDSDNSTTTDEPGFNDETVLDGMNQPLEVTFLPDGQMLVLEKGGRILIANPETGQRETYMTITDLNSQGERGLLGIALDPDFAQNGYFYVYYSDGRKYNQISRFTHVENSGGLTSRGDLASEVELWVNPDRSNGPCCHFGGGFGIGPDGMIYLATGEEFNGSQAQDLSTAKGKIIRINRDGSIPDDNPFVDDPAALDEIWAYGLRNPFTATWDYPTNRLFIGEVGGNDDSVAQEDINVGEKGANYGWPECEGYCDDPRYTDPIYSYPHDGSGASVSVGTVYRGTQFPSEYQGALFYGDYVDGYIKYLKFDSSGAVTGTFDFHDNAGAVVDIHEGPDGALYYVDIAGGTVKRLSAANGAPTITAATADPTSGSPPLTVSFNGSATDPNGDPLTYNWTFGDGSSVIGRNVTHTYDGAGVYTARLTVSDGTSTTLSDPIEIAVGDGPNATITLPANGSLFRAGDTIAFEGTGSDPEDGTLSGDSLTWTIDFIHDEHTHPTLSDVTGTSGSFDIDRSGHDYSSNTGYRINLTATDSDGLTDTDTVIVEPDKVDVTFDTAPSGLTFELDGIPHTTPYTHDTLIDFVHQVSAPTDQCVDGTQYEFVGWSDGGAATHNYTVPTSDSSLTANYDAIGNCTTTPAVEPVLQLEVDQGVSTSGSSVTGWADGSGTNNDLTANGAPTLVANATPSGMDAISFDGSDDELVRTGTLAGFSTGASDRTMIVVTKYDSTGFGGVVYGRPKCNQAFGTVVDGQGDLTVQGWCSANDFPSGTAGTGAGWLVQSVVVEGNAVTHYKDGTPIDTGTHAFDTGAAKLAIGSELDGGPHLDMEIAAVYVYDQALTDTERQQLESNLQEKYLAGDGSTPNQAPTAVDDSATVTQGNTTTIDILANDDDSDGTLNASSVVVESGPANGTVTVDTATGAVTYTHDGSSATSDSLTYTVADDAGARSNVATVSISVSSDSTGETSTVPVTDGLALDLDARSGVSTSGESVTAWSDRSGLGNDVSANGVPTLVSSATPAGTAAIDFDGTDDELVRTGTLAGFPTGASDRTMIVVTRYDGTGFGGVAYGQTKCNQAFGTVVNGQGDLTVQGWCNDFPSTTAGTGAGWLTQSVVLDNSTFTHYKNGTQIDTASHTFDTGAAKLAIGSELGPPPYLDMQVAAVLVYDRALTDTERQEVEAYLQETYGTGGTTTTNQAPTAGDDTATVERGNSTTIDVLANDGDPDGTLNVSSIRIESDPANGTVTVDTATGAVTYTHDGSTAVDDVFTYTVADDNGTRSNVATVAISVSDSGSGTGGSSDVPVTDGLVLGLNASEGVTTSGSSVTGWADGSGNGNDLTANGAPTLQTGALNGQDAISFDGSDDELVRTSSLTSFPTGASDRTMIVVTRYDSTGFGGVAYGWTKCNEAFGTVVDGQGELTIQGWCSANDFPSTTAGTGAGWLTQSVVVEGNAVTHYKDGTQIDTGTHAFDTGAAKLAIGAELDGGPHLDMEIAAVYVYDRALTDTERGQVETYLQDTYGTGSGASTANEAPTANDDSATVDAGNSTTIDVLANDTDIDGTLNASSVVVESGPTNGTVTVDETTGVVTYTHDGSSTASDSFTYSVADDGGARSNVAIVSISVSDTGTGDEGTSSTVPVTDGLVLDLDARAGVSTSGESVTSWSDRSGLGNDVSANGAPTLVSGATPAGTAAISFDGTDDELVRTGTLAGFPTGASDRTMIVVTRYDGTGFGGVAYGQTKCNQAFGTVVNGQGELTVQGWCSANDFPSTTAGTGAGWLTQSVVLDNDTFTHYEDGARIGNGTHAFDTGAAKLAIGSELDAAPYVDMQVAAVLVYDRALTEAERGQVETYLQDTYGTDSSGTNTTANEAPTANDDSATVERGNSTTIDVLTNDDDPDGTLDASSVRIESGPANGIVTVNETTGAVTYTHDGSTAVDDAFTYTVADDDGTRSNVAVVSINAFDEGTSSDVPVTDGLVLDLDARAGVSTSGPSVTGWADRSGLDNDLTANGAPTLVSSATPTGVDAISFDGTDDELVRTGPLTGFATGSSDRTMVVVTKYDSTGFGGVAYGRPECNRAFGTVVNGDGALTVQGWCPANDLTPGVAGTGAGWLTQSVILEGNAVTHYKNGTQIDTASHAFDTGTAKLAIGSELDGVPLVDMEVAAVLIYDRALTDTERQQVEAYLQETYGTDAAAAMNEAPTANGDSASVNRSESVVIDVLANDTDPDGTLNASSVVVESGPANGTVTVDTATGAVTYTHDGSTAVDDAFTYTVADDAGARSNVATVAITVTETTTNEAPVAADDSATVDAGNSTTIDVLANDTDTDGTLNTSSVVIESDPANGTVAVDDATGAVTYTHDGSTATSDSFTYSVADNNDTRSNVATVSISVSDDETSSGGSSAVPITDGLVLDLDARAGVSTSGESVTGWADGSGLDNDLTANGAPTLVANATPSGMDAISFDGTDDELVRTGPLTSFPTGANDRTMIVVTKYDSTGFGGVAYGRPKCNQAFGTVVNGQGELTVQGWCSANDFPSGTAGPGAGWLTQSVVLEGNAVTQYKNGTLIDSATHTFDTDVAKLAIGSELKPGPYVDMEVAAVLVYDRALTDTERQQVETYLQDTYGTDAATAVNQAPTAADDAASVDTGNSTTIDVLANDTDSDGTLNASSVVVESEPTSGTVTVDETTGAVTYTHDGSSATSDSLTYTVADDAGARSNVATVSISVNEPTTATTNEAPTANDDATTINRSESIVIDVLANDTDSDGTLNASSVVVEGEPVNGTVTVDTATGAITYVHDGSAATTDSFTYTVADDNGTRSNVATVSLTITESDTNQAPTAADDSATVDAGNSTTIDVLANDTDIDGTLNASSVVVESGPANGTVTVDTATGAVTYTHDGSSATSDSLTYTVADDAGARSNVATVSISVNETTTGTALIASDPMIGSSFERLTPVGRFERLG